MATNGKYDFVQRFFTKRDGKMRLCSWQNVRFNKTSGWTTSLLHNVAGGYYPSENYESLGEMNRLDLWGDGKEWLDCEDRVSPKIQIHKFPELPFLYARGT